MNGPAPPDGLPEHGETWTRDGVSLRVSRPAWLRYPPLVTLTVLGGFAATLVVWFAQGGVGWGTAALVAFGILWLVLLYGVAAWLNLPLTVTIGPDKLRVGQREFERRDLEGVQRMGDRFVVLLRNQPNWSSPQLSPVDADRLLALMQRAVPSRAALAEELREEELARRELHGVRQAKRGSDEQAP